MLLDGISRGPSARTLAPDPVKPAGTRACPVRSRRVAGLAHCPQYAPVSAAAWVSERHLDKPVRCGIEPVIEPVTRLSCGEGPVSGLGCWRAERGWRWSRMSLLVSGSGLSAGVLAGFWGFAACRSPAGRR